MKNVRIITNTLFVIFCAMICHTKSFAEPLNLQHYKKTLQEYYHSGLYQQEITKIAAKAERYITREAEINAHRHHPKKLAIVLDVDETTLTYYRYIEKMNFCHDPDNASRFISNHDVPPIKPILELYKDAIKHNIAVFFITARPQQLYEATKRNLRKAGFNTWAGLYTRSTNYHERSMALHKREKRRLITQKGYTIIASIGDQESDLSGGYAQKTFKLPNPFYFIL